MPPVLELIKARLTVLVLGTTAVGFIMGHSEPLLVPRFLWTLLGTALAAAGANAFNQWTERKRDACMDRTRQRPLPASRMTPSSAFAVALVLSLSGILDLAILVNPLTAALGVFVILLYVLIYTPLKHQTPFCTLIGAICGAVPPVMGYTGATGELSLEAWILALTLFLWQIPHFLSLAWLYRDDYLRGGFRMLPAVDPTGSLTALLVVIYTLALLPLGLLSLAIGMTGWVFLGGSLILGSGFLVLGWELLKERTEKRARRVFVASLLYLPILLLLFLVDRGPVRGLEPRLLGRNDRVSSSPAKPLPQLPEPVHTRNIHRAGDVRPWRRR